MRRCGHYPELCVFTPFVFLRVEDIYFNICYCQILGYLLDWCFSMWWSSSGFASFPSDLIKASKFITLVHGLSVERSYRNPRMKKMLWASVLMTNPGQGIIHVSYSDQTYSSIFGRIRRFLNIRRLELFWSPIRNSVPRIAPKGRVEFWRTQGRTPSSRRQPRPNT